MDEATRDNWVLETARATLRRIEAVEDALEMESPTIELLVNLGYSRSLSEGVVLALEHYKDTDLNRYRGIVLESLEQLLPDHQLEMQVPEELPTGPEEIEDVEEEDKEEVVLKLIDKLDKGGKGSPWNDIIKEAEKVGIGKDELEEISNSLLDKGLIYEPVLGKMKRI